jgi:hypothetical protein
MPDLIEVNDKMPDLIEVNDKLSGAELLDDLTTQILQYVVLKKHEARAIALWIVHTHAFDLFLISPRLKIQSPEPVCGKTTLLDVLYYTVRNPLLTAHATAAAVFRTIGDSKPTLLIDEADTSLVARDLVTILNAGHRRNDAWVVRTDGRFSVWALRPSPRLKACRTSSTRDRSRSTCAVGGRTKPSSRSGMIARNRSVACSAGQPNG